MNASRQKRKSQLDKIMQKKLIVSGLIILSVVIFDQVTKIMAINHLSSNPPVEVFGKFLMFSLVYNYGGALGTNLGPSIYYLISSALILFFVLYYLYKNIADNKVAIPLSFICGGAMGNIIDRVRIGKVIDFIDIDFFDIDIFGYQLQRWWTFNIADAAISCSLVFLLFYMARHNVNGQHQKETNNQLVGD